MVFCGVKDFEMSSKIGLRAEDNMMLAKKRASSVIQYLVSTGIDGKRLKATSKGESSPVALNTNPDGSDSPYGRKLNRRVEFNILKPDLPNVKIEEIQVPENLKK